MTFPLLSHIVFSCILYALSFAGNGYITTAVLREILKELDDKITNEDLDLMIEEIDADGSGTVDFDGKYETRGKNVANQPRERDFRL